jgi:polysaccharide pyruvyl transferase WcaK-like protein
MIGVITAWGATVGDNLITELLMREIQKRNKIAVKGYQKGCKLAVWGGGGLLWQYILNNLIHSAKDAIQDKVNVIGLGLGNQGLFDKERFMFLKDFKVITVRNPQTQETLKELLGVDSIVTQDLVWLYDPPKANTGGNTVGVIFPNISRYPLVMQGLSRLKAMRILYIPFQPPAIEQYKQARSLAGGEILNQSHSKAFEQISKCRFIIAGHLHGMICSMLTNTPVIVVPLRDKIRWQCEWIGYNKYYAMTDDEIVVKANLILQNENKVKHQISNIVQVERAKSKKNIDILTKWL